MKKAFTLVELIAVIAILCVIAGISVPVLINNLSNKKEEARDKLIQIIKTAAKGYAIDNELDYPTDVLLTDLCGEYLDCPIIDPVSDSEINGYVKININGEAQFISN